MRWQVGLLLAVALLGASCTSDLDEGEDGETPSRSTALHYSYPAPPAAPDGALRPRTEEALNRLVDTLVEGPLDRNALDALSDSKDARVGWFLSDLLRFIQTGGDQVALIAAFQALTGVDPRDDPSFAQSAWRSITNHLIAWDLPAPPGYRELKARLFLQVEPAWRPFFEDASSAIDWRLISWGGVFIDDRPEGDTDACPRGCIPALDDPPLVPAAKGDWYPDDRLVFGVVSGDEAVALPKNIMEVHEMVNMTIAGKRVAIPYCTLCGSAHAYLTEFVPHGVSRPVLRTSGLLSRSNKVMYDLNTKSVFDTFTGRALSGPMHDAKVVLEQTTVVTSTWGDWKLAHPDTRIVAEDGGVGHTYSLDPLGGRDDDGPIFPTGPVDPRLPVLAQVLGVITPSGEALAFPVEQSRAALSEGRRVAIGRIEVVADGGGLRARAGVETELATHQAFWFAWSQFHPDTVVWTPLEEDREVDE